MAKSITSLSGAELEQLLRLPTPSISDAHASRIQADLDVLVEKYERPAFVAHDPISIPKHYTYTQDQEIMGLFAALFAWGRRDITLAKCAELSARMNNRPLQFVLGYNHSSADSLKGFVHRTFCFEDLDYFMLWFQGFYRRHESLEQAFLPPPTQRHLSAGAAIAWFHHRFLESAPTHRVKKHISTPLAGATCKRLSMFLRWMVRPSLNGVDLGLWQTLSPSQLICPIDVHVHNIAQEYGLLDSSLPNWKAALQLTANLAKLCPEDPVKYDFALFSLGEEASRTRSKA